MPSVLVVQVTLEHLRHATPNVLLAPIVLSTKHARIKSALIHALVPAVTTRSVKFSITRLSAVALPITRAILSFDASEKRVRRFLQNQSTKLLNRFPLVQPVLREPEHPCIPSPCGPSSNCREVNGQAVCSCVQNYIGRPPNCRPECTTNSECTSSLACINDRCKDPCPGACGFEALCHVINHSPVCSCMNGYTGDPFSGCTAIQSKTL